MFTVIALVANNAIATAVALRYRTSHRPAVFTALPICTRGALHLRLAMIPAVPGFARTAARPGLSCGRPAIQTCLAVSPRGTIQTSLAVSTLVVIRAAACTVSTRYRARNRSPVLAHLAVGATSTRFRRLAVITLVAIRAATSAITGRDCARCCA